MYDYNIMYCGGLLGSWILSNLVSAFTFIQYKPRILHLADHPVDYAGIV